MKDLSQEKVGLRTVAVLTGLDRDSIRAAIVRSNVQPAGKAGGHDVFTLSEIMRALFDRRGEVDPATLTPIERRNLADAKLKEFQLAVKRNEYFPRNDVIEAINRSYFALRQAILSLPDWIERRLGLGPEVLEILIPVCDDALAMLGESLEKIHAERPLLSDQAQVEDEQDDGDAHVSPDCEIRP